MEKKIVKKPRKPSKAYNTIRRTNRAEGDIREAAFWQYVALGRDRSLKALAQKTNIPQATLNSWSQKYNWGARIQNIAEKIKQEHEKAIMTEAKKVLEQDKQIAQVLLTNLLEQFRREKNTGTLKFTYADIQRIIELQLKMHGLISTQSQINVYQTNQTIQANQNIDLYTKPPQDSDQITEEFLQQLDPFTRAKVIDALKKTTEKQTTIDDSKIVDAVISQTTEAQQQDTTTAPETEEETK